MIINLLTINLDPPMSAFQFATGSRFRLVRRRHHFWSLGCCVTTIGLDEEKIRKYVKYQEQKERLEKDIEHQLGLI